jgi:integrase
MRVAWQAHRVDVATLMSVPTERFWVSGAFAPSFKTAEGVPASVMNRRLRQLAAAVDDVFSRFFILEKRAPSVAEFRSLLDAELGRGVGDADGGLSVQAALSEFVGLSGVENGWSLGTHKKFKTLGRHLAAYKRGALLSEIDEGWLRGFMLYLQRRGFRNSTTMKLLGLLRWFLRWAVRHGYPVPSDFESFRPHLRGTDVASHLVIYLEWEELMSLWSLDLSARPALDHVRDVFCFCCFSGLRYSDVAKLRRSDIVDGSLRVVTKKTADPLVIELNSWSRSILEKYADFPLADGLALPVISNQKTNAALKELGRLAGLVQPVRLVFFRGAVRVEETRAKWELLTSHCARRTFVVQSLRLGIPAEVIMKWTGHSDFSAMKPYVAIVDSLKAEAMSRFDALAGEEGCDG